MDMKLGLLLVFGVVFIVSGHGQTFAEWWQQNSTRLKYYAKQVADLEAYLGEVKHGYQVCNTGISAIGSGKQAEFDLHNGYYNSFERVNPALGAIGEVTEILALQTAIIRRFSAGLG